MSAADELELQGVAQELVAEFGRDVSLVGPGTTNVSPTEPWKGKAAKGASQTVKAVFIDLKKELVQGTAIQLGDSLAIIASTSLTPAGRKVTSADIIVDGSSQWAIVVAIESKPGNSSFVWFAQVRQAGA